MTSAYATLEARLYDIMVNGRGVNGALGADALAKSIPVGRFRAARQNAPLRDTTYPSVDFDRAVFVFTGWTVTVTVPNELLASTTPLVVPLSVIR